MVQTPRLTHVSLETHFVDSSGVVSWKFLGEEPDHAFADWNFSTTTQEDYDWLCACIAAEGKDVYISDFEALDVYACRILVPGMSEIYPVEDLQWENNSVGNDQAISSVFKYIEVDDIT
jgi:ribosomal protein S12 methylthiotransferase accessory factor